LLNDLFINFNWQTFFLALMFFVLVSNLFNLGKTYYKKARLDTQAKQAEAKLQKLQKELKDKETELNQLLEIKEK